MFWDESTPFVVHIFVLQACSARPELIGETGKGESEQLGLTRPMDAGFEVPLEEVDGIDYVHLPILFIDTRGQSIGNTTKIDADLEVIRLHDGTHDDLNTASRTFSGPIGIEIHGSSSQGYPNRGIALKRETKAVRTWMCLWWTSMKAAIGCSMPLRGQDVVEECIGVFAGATVGRRYEEYQPGGQLCEVYPNGSYNGVYLLVSGSKEEATGDIARVADSAADGDITGGYIVKLDQGRNSYCTPLWQHVQLRVPALRVHQSRTNHLYSVLVF